MARLLLLVVEFRFALTLAQWMKFWGLDWNASVEIGASATRNLIHDSEKN
jgi:hypothetical protein